MKKDIIRSIIIIGLIVTLTVSSTYAFMNYNTSSNSSNTQAGCFEVTYQGTAVNNIAVAAGTDYSGTGNSAHPVVKLSKTSDCKIYTEASIYLSVDSGSQVPLPATNAAAGAFKYKVMNGTTEVASGVVQKSNNDILLATVALTNSLVTYDIYFWLDINLSGGEYHGKSFSGKVYAKSDQDSSITS